MIITIMDTLDAYMGIYDIGDTDPEEYISSTLDVSPNNVGWRKHTLLIYN